MQDPFPFEVPKLISGWTIPMSVMRMVCVAGFDFPRGPGAYAPRFCCGPLDFSD